uniref:Histone acetyltransferase n=1 Tax=Chlamydomonas leiostraca TaxID=1034604 RepID=A0A7S0RE57_9CHLO|mmetsp:Transcript_19883/g.50440  ORF Transcript_19883/g.50440 Transcript_19883/m.50440 type:complete len:594 (+) Transcript_19883:131-1912(+)
MVPPGNGFGNADQQRLGGLGGTDQPSGKRRRTSKSGAADHEPPAQTSQPPTPTGAQGDGFGDGFPALTLGMVGPIDWEKLGYGLPAATSQPPYFAGASTHGIKQEGGEAAAEAAPGAVAAAAGGAAAQPAAAAAGGAAANGKGGKGMGKGRAILPAAAAAEAAAAAAQKLKEDAAAAALAAAAAAAGGVPTSGGYMRPGEVKHPLEIGTKASCMWKDEQYHTAKIIERRQKEGCPVKDPNSWEYYVHYMGYNRRMDEWVQLAQFDLATVEVEIPDPDPKKKKKAVLDDHDSDSDHGDFDPNALREHEEFTKVKNIDQIELGRHVMDTWYFSPFPPEYKDCKKLYFCEYTLAFFKRRSQMLRHMNKCRTRHPPGEEIYRNGNVCMFEVDGKREKAFCQNLCFLAKLFLDHKTLYYDVDLFLFYILCEIDERGAHVVGYFSKEKCSEEGYNLACILCFPAYQRKGYGKFLISMSYELSKIEGKVGTPERPLSDLGRTAYHGYWTRELLGVLRDHEGPISIKELSERTSIRPDDAITTLQTLGMLQQVKGQHVICAAPKVVAHHLKAAGGAGLRVDPTLIVWTPYNAEREYANLKT